MKFSAFDRDLAIHAGPRRPERPLVSVILPTFARGDGLLQASIDSVLSQSFGDFELIVVDDGSRDATAEALMQYVKDDERVIVHRYHLNSGLPAVRVNQAALRSKGRFIAYQFDDDLWTPDSLLKRINHIKDAPQPSVVYGNCRVIENFGTPAEKVAWLGGEFNFGRLMGGNYIANNTILHHKELFDLAGMYDPHVVYRRYSDYDLWLRFARHAPFHWIDEVVSEVRVNLANSLGKEVPSYFTRYRKSISTGTRRALLPGRISDYDVIDPAQFEPMFTRDEMRQYYRMEVVPFLSRWNDYCSPEEMSTAASGGMSPVNLLVLKPDYSTSIEVTIGNYANLDHQRSVRSTFVRESDAPAVEANSFDVTLMYRTVLESTARFAEQPAAERGPVAYLMDDNMLHMHELEGANSHLSPKSVAYKSIQRQISHADAAIGYSQPIIDDMRALNRHVIRLDTNIPARFVERSARTRDGRLRIALLSGPVRTDIVRDLWAALERIADRYADQVEFHFWGLNPDQFGKLSVPTRFVPFTHAYDRYRDALAAAAFDVVLVPLEGSFRAHQSKSPIKLLEALSAGAICIFSDVPPYTGLPSNVCLRVGNDVDQWYAAIENAINLGPDGREAMVEAAREHVLSRYTTEGQFFDFFGAMSSVRLHSRLGQGAVALAFHETALGGATLHLLRHAQLLTSLGIRLVGLAPKDARHEEEFSRRWGTATGGARLFMSEWASGYDDVGHRAASPDDAAEAAALAELLRPEEIKLLHYATWSPPMMQLAKALNVASVASVHQYYPGADTRHIADSIHCSSLTHGEQWRRASKVPTRRVVCPVGDEYFSLFRPNRTRVSRQSAGMKVLLSGTLQPRKGQLVALRALEMLASRGVDLDVDVIGYTEFAPEYFEECLNLAESPSLKGRVTFHGFVQEPSQFYATADVLLIAASDESMPQTILQAMAAGVAVVSTNVGGVSEIVRHRYSGHLAAGFTAEAIADAVAELIALPVPGRLELLDRAQRTIGLLARPGYVRAELVDIYLEALERAAKRVAIVAAPAPPAPVAVSVPTKPVVDLGRDEAVRMVSDLHAKVVQFNAARSLTLARFLRGAAGKAGAWRDLDASFHSMAHYSDGLHRPRRGDRLELTEDLRTVPYREYRIGQPLPALRGVALAVVPLVSATRGHMGLELVSADGQILAHLTRELVGVTAGEPTVFHFDQPVTGLGSGWLLRAFVEDSDVPTAIYEVVRRPLFSRRRQRGLPFVELLA